ncbi:hypothetical protein SAMN05444365_101877 [Micromonospora pattaloongensis]|uniref:Uncharacterized protein n=1 Tax=Micromonospora pattaloongensis TaxID=405436 RepID=A0A1H3HKT0_9ACTN|nr:hypothetical protein SAMN05444365_101877 [Micromonospora pattaloongensis]
MIRMLLRTGWPGALLLVIFLVVVTSPLWKRL